MAGEEYDYLFKGKVLARLRPKLLGQKGALKNDRAGDAFGSPRRDFTHLPSLCAPLAVVLIGDSGVGKSNLLSRFTRSVGAW